MDEQLRILLVEDASADAELVRLEFERALVPCSIRRAVSRDEFLHELTFNVPELILADYCLPQFTAVEALGLLRERNEAIPLIVVTGSNSEEVAVQCLQ